MAAATGPDGLIYVIGGSDSTNTSVATVEAYASDKCYPIAHQILVVENNISVAESNLGDLPLKDRGPAEKQIAELTAELKNLQAQLKTCRGG